MKAQLIRHDLAIAKAAARLLTRRRADLFTVLLGVPSLTLVGRAWVNGWADTERDLIAFGASALISASIAQGLSERVRFHQSDGVLARFAQGSGAWLTYTMPLLAAGVLANFIGMAAIGMLAPGSFILGTCIGLPTGLAIPFLRERAGSWWRLLAPTVALDLRRHRFGLAIGGAASLAVGLICAVVHPTTYVGLAVTGCYGFIVIILTGRIDASTVRFMTLVGHGGSALLRRWLPIQVALLAPGSFVLLFAQEWVAAGVSAAVALGLPIVTTLRIFAYRVFTPLLADWMVAGVIAAICFVTLNFPPLGPLVVIAAIYWLVRRGSETRWLLP